MATTMAKNEAGIVEKVAEARASFRGGRTPPRAPGIVHSSRP